MLLLAGDGPLRKRLNELISETGIGRHVVMTGQVPHSLMPELLAAADVVAVPSVQVAGVEEASSLILLEGMASGKPVVASEIGGMRDLIQNRVTGFLVPPTGITAMSDALTEILQDAELAKSLGERARQHVVANHSSESVGRKVMNIYETILESR